MSRNSKNARLHAKAKEVTKIHLSGGKCPPNPSTKHGKKHAWWQMYHSYAAFTRGAKKQSRARDSEVEEVE